MKYPSSALAERLSSNFALFVLVFGIVVGVPLFVRLPPWPDLTLYEEAAANILSGGVHYRDVFDTNLPGFVWCIAIKRVFFGDSVIAARVVDLLVVSGITLVVQHWLKRADVPRVHRLWFCAGMALFYLYTTEYCHVQRDTWMLLPAAGAALLMFGNSKPPWFLVGVLWGCAVWIKPHVVIPAAMLFFVPRCHETWREALRGRALLFLGGAVTGAAGVVWIVATGAWPHFVEVFTEWNTSYTETTLNGIWDRLNFTYSWFRFWSLGHALAWFACAWCIFCSIRRRQDVALRARAVLCLLYLGWMLQAIVFQRNMDYIHVPTIFLMLAVLASVRVAASALVFVWLCFCGIGYEIDADAMEEANPTMTEFAWEKPRMFSRYALSLWPEAVMGPSSYRLQDDLAYFNTHCEANFVELDGVAQFLRQVDPPLKDRELLAFHDSPHPLYRMLNVKPAARFMHYGTALEMRPKQPQIAAEVRAAKPRFIVADMFRMAWPDFDPHAPARSGDYLALPHWFPLSQRMKFPWNQTLVYRSGRYFVYEVTQPIGDVDIPEWKNMKNLGPGEP